jgi:TetR/AcrR family transcriptional regulator, cholesterol catabolism regulator
MEKVVPRTVPEGATRSILAAAAGLFRRQGYGATTMRDIANAVGLSKAGLYHHYQSKEELLTGIVTTGTEALLRQLRAVESSGLPPEQKLREFVRTRMQTIAEYQDMLTVIWQERPIIDQETFAVLAKQLEGYRAGTAGLVEEGRQAGIISPDVDPHLLMLAIDGMTGWSYLWMRPGQGYSPTEIGDHFWHYLWRGVQPPDSH